MTFSSPSVRNHRVTLHQRYVAQIVVPKVKSARILVSDESSAVENPDPGNLREFSENRIKVSHAPFDESILQEIAESLILLRRDQTSGLLLDCIWIL